MPPCYDNSSARVTLFSGDNYIPTRVRFRSCKASNNSTVSYRFACGPMTDRMEIDEHFLEDCESRFNASDSSLFETKIIVLLRTQIFEKWSIDLTNTSSAYFRYLSQFYSSELITPLKNIKKIGGDYDSAGLSSLISSWKILFSSVRVISFTEATELFLKDIEHVTLSSLPKSNIRRLIERQTGTAARDEAPIEIKVEVEAVFDTLADEDDNNVSGVTANAEKTLKETLKTTIEETMASEIENKIANPADIQDGETNFVDNFEVYKTEFVNCRLSENGSCEKTVLPAEKNEITVCLRLFTFF